VEAAIFWSEAQFINSSLREIIKSNQIREIITDNTSASYRYFSTLIGCCLRYSSSTIRVSLVDGVESCFGCPPALYDC
jgi:hypothetical protein